MEQYVFQRISTFAIPVETETEL